jgi:hypothetical protein
MNPLIIELYELSDAMTFMEECLDGLATQHAQHHAGNAYLVGLMGRRLAEIADVLEHAPQVDAAGRMSADAAAGDDSNETT